MLRDPKVIEYLNTQLTNELTAVNHKLPARAHVGALGRSEVRNMPSSSAR